jgi:hypothetical protein
MASLKDELEARGFVHVARHLPAEEFEAMCSSLGNITGRSDVALRKEAHSYVARPEAVPFHTDFVVDIIAWRCDVQDPLDGASLLLEASTVIGKLSPALAMRLRNTVIEMRAMPAATPHRREVIQCRGATDRMSFAPWLRPAEGDRSECAAYDALRCAVTASVTEAHAVRLMPGEALFVDNGRFLHGRGPLAVDSPRKLSRRWINLIED